MLQRGSVRLELVCKVRNPLCSYCERFSARRS